MFSLASCGFGTVTEMIKRVLLGQALAFLNSITGVSTTKLVENNASYPVLQSVTAYAFIFAFYMPAFLVILYKYRGCRFSNFTFLKRWWKYAILAAIDLEANYVVVLAYQYTNLMSVQLLSCFTVPCVLVFSFLLLRSKFAITHVAGGVVAIGGLVFLITLDADGLSRSESGSKEVLGDMLCLLSSALYAVSNVLTEWFVKPSKTALVFNCCKGGQAQAGIDDTTPALPPGGGPEPIGPVAEEGDLDASEDYPKVPVFIPVVENLAMMSSFALVFATIQFFAAEWTTFKPNRGLWSGQDWLFQMVFGITMLLLYTAMPVMFVISSAAFANISLLTANIYGIIWNVTIFKIYPTRLFFVSYVIIVVGIVLYSVTDMVRIPFCSRWNYPCGDPFKEDGDDGEEEVEEELRNSLGELPQQEAGSNNNEPCCIPPTDSAAKPVTDGAGQVDESRREL
ncbi:EamA-like transporter family [Novymonas esmeraldas]|uniref:EamA-like transporter family n=1 Tax=Novymonas esmeraldas TaxID=1808958 RepID=A0AAW0F324_9TRYP